MLVGNKTHAGWRACLSTFDTKKFPYSQADYQAWLALNLIASTDSEDTRAHELVGLLLAVAALKSAMSVGRRPISEAILASEEQIEQFIGQTARSLIACQNDYATNRYRTILASYGLDLDVLAELGFQTDGWSSTSC